ncbi:MAG: hypothetical protein ACRBFS_25785 [Aureispira sp.]
MNISEELAKAPNDIKPKYDAQQLLFLNCRCFSWRFLPNLLLIPVFGALGGISITSITAPDVSIIDQIFRLVVGIAFLGVVAFNVKHSLMYLLGRVELCLSKEGGKIQWYWGKIAVGKKDVFYWEDVKKIYLGQPKKPENDKDVLVVIKGKTKLILHRFLRYRQLIYLEALLTQVLTAHQEGTLALAPDWTGHLIDPS